MCRLSWIFFEIISRYFGDILLSLIVSRKRKHCRQTSSFSFLYTCRELRRSYNATSSWHQRSITAFLGHNPQRHFYFESSAGAILVVGPGQRKYYWVLLYVHVVVVSKNNNDGSLTASCFRSDRETLYGPRIFWTWLISRAMIRSYLIPCEDIPWQIPWRYQSRTVNVQHIGGKSALTPKGIPLLALIVMYGFFRSELRRLWWTFCLNHIDHVESTRFRLPRLLFKHRQWSIDRDPHRPWLRGRCHLSFLPPRAIDQKRV